MHRCNGCIYDRNEDGDLILRKVNVDRYDDRDLVRTNLIESYDRIIAFVKKHLADPFYLEGSERRSLRYIIFREVASNMLIHREYASGATSRLIIEYGRVITDNPSHPHGFGPMSLETAVPFQKNPVLSAFIRVIDRADELGFGMRKMMLWGKRYGGRDPQLIEGDNFRLSPLRSGGKKLGRKTTRPQTLLLLILSSEWATLMPAKRYKKTVQSTGFYSLRATEWQYIARSSATAVAIRFTFYFSV